ncbi:MAG TPA: tripartite tricarboxylate transporter substrate binding protein [Candidatus Sulfotelmatobacter sp.]|nr:tripartite tricarboxylate transporter substrate binding protein [Candidatus Sulfotelmatobacter sp.]
MKIVDCGRRGTLAGLVLACLVTAAAALAQPYPTKPITIVHGFGAGGGADILLRAVTPAMSERLEQPVVIDYKVGAGGNIAFSYVARSEPDGYTLLMATPGLITNPFVYAAAQYDPLRDFTPVGPIGSVPQVLVVNPALPARSVAELIALAKAKPGTLNYSSSGVGTSLHLTGELFRVAAGIDIVHVPYKGALQAESDIVSGQVQMMFNVLPSALPMIKSGQLRALAVTSAERAATLPDTPTMIEAGLPDFTALTWNGIVAPAGTPAPIVARLNAALIDALKLPAVRERLAGMGQDAWSSTPEAFAAFLRDEQTKWAPVIKAAGIRAQ